MDASVKINPEDIEKVKILFKEENLDYDSLEKNEFIVNDISPNELRNLLKRKAIKFEDIRQFP